MPYNLKFHRGDKVKHLVEGCEGVVVGYYIPADGMIMYSISVKKQKEKAEYENETTTICVDEVSLDLIEACKPDDPFYGEFVTDTKYKIGDLVEDILSPENKRGRICSITCFTNNCIHYGVVTERLSDKGKQVTVKIAESMVRKVEDSPIKQADKPVKKKTGGPSFAMHREELY